MGIYVSGSDNSTSTTGKCDSAAAADGFDSTTVSNFVRYRVGQ